MAATKRDIATMPRHPNNDECAAAQQGILYNWLSLFLHLKQIPGVKLPKKKNYSQYWQVKNDALTRLKNMFNDDSEGEDAVVKQTEEFIWDVATRVQAIAHQADCVTYEPYGLALEISKRLFSSSHQNRELGDPTTNRALEISHNHPGDILAEQPVENFYVFHMYAQQEPGPPTALEDSEKRYVWFRQCLDKITLFCQQHSISTIAFPRRIGCSEYTGGDWVRYEQLIEQWAIESSEVLTVTIAGPEN